jgi:hypothetical protein
MKNKNKQKLFIGWNDTTKQYLFMGVNFIILISLIYILYSYTNPLKEGITNMGCCGGVEAGVHYQETDLRPPDYIKRCFSSTRDSSTSHIDYQWNGFPCSSHDGEQCCPDVSNAECVPTTGGGYCKSDLGNKVFKRGANNPSSYIKLGSDKLLDINDTLDMEDYFFDRSKGQLSSKMSPDMLAFMERKDQNNEYIKSHIIDKNRAKIKEHTEQKIKAETEKKELQIKTTITFVHIICVLGFSIVIKDLIIKYIDDFYSLLNTRYLEFSGKKLQ